ncbi:MAG: hypothetical protein F6K30_21065 [Cyanothece sp. SIO2G6]|nr:hypothetical protein [Cyanothece sp. SIO2G6]
MAHTFLLEAGRWILQGHWLNREGPPIPVKGRILVAWNRDWYALVTKLTFPGSERPDLTFQYRGHFAADDRRYSFVLQHSELGRVEGEGWIAPGSIVQRYWVLGDKKKRRTGFETLNQLSDDRYYMSSSVMSGHYLSSTMEASVQRQVQK